MADRDAVTKVLREKAVKVTPQRVAVLEFLYENPDHPSADEVYRQVQRRYPNISRATIYNTIKALTENGLLQEILVQQEKTHVDWNVSSHHHFRCKQCGKVEDVPYEVLTAEKVAERLEGHQVDKVRVLMEGSCKNCR